MTKPEFLLTISLLYQPENDENEEKYQFEDNKLIQY